ncbi:uncharacterized protein L969DRAFT_95052 [Mixia osmundae IAM 14324]|uniref:Non-structural maintenance of chromosomes element 1 homolog n=1 Tax=Mixia osmundae (strain CBS 9802 / IAM 14324 / JCM 22182 / KY 12970) TaxID=764103 RepID=G7E8I5_MIXOS|nr:uncharacterized protein L969DRAFT_95052 [Mixia osmundae IAM 14324]KEI38885.1 hypothetical protein L969DRAFT_95052 [Mixia osmundae IAM 14324]GAA99145.1 hypothetical protein E5Q_05836 [Mixia osmundae IAM 14324]
MLKRSCEIAQVETSELADALTTINATLSELGFEIRHTIEQRTGKACYVFVNTMEDKASAASSDMNHAELSYLKVLIGKILGEPSLRYCIDHAEALRASNDKSIQPQITKTQAQKTLSIYIAKGWLEKSPKGNYCLSTRTLVELGKFFEGYEAETQDWQCASCLSPVTIGYQCASCPTRLHKFCVTRGTGRQHICPKCKVAWPATSSPCLVIGEDAGVRTKRAKSEELSSGEAESEDDV